MCIKLQSKLCWSACNYCRRAFFHFKPIRYLLCCLAFGWGACQNQSHPRADANVAYYHSIKHLTGVEFDERLKLVDSLRFLFYDNPDGDEKRYTRFYAEYHTVDPSIIRVVQQAADKKFNRLERIRQCRSQGKIFLFEKGIPKQTLYFSNRGDSCSHVYFIKDGWFYYMEMDSATAKLLSLLRPVAQKPSGVLPG